MNKDFPMANSLCPKLIPHAKRVDKMVQALAGAAQGGVSLATLVSYAMRQRRELPLEPHPRTGSRGAWAALFVPTVLQHAWEQAALTRPLSIPAILSTLFACGIRRFSFTPFFHAPMNLTSTIERPGQSASTAALPFSDAIEGERSLSITKANVHHSHTVQCRAY